MPKEPVIAVVDIGRTNKKLVLFDQQYRNVYEQSSQLPETADEDGFPCDDVDGIRTLVFQFLHEVSNNDRFEVRALNFTSYGASFVYVDERGLPLSPLYSYLKPYPESLHKRFYETHGGEEAVSLQTASPVLGSLNSGLQLFRIQNEQPEVFRRLHYALHLPQYLSFLISNKPCSDLTSIGCHTSLWNFQINDYHKWVHEEGIRNKLAPIFAADTVTSASWPGGTSTYVVGVGIHDSSAALIPYQLSFSQPFVLLSTGTWSISLNPFNKAPLTVDELRQDCLCYMHFKGMPVKASRLFLGNEHEEAAKRIGAHFGSNPDAYRNLRYDPETIGRLKKRPVINPTTDNGHGTGPSLFIQRDLSHYSDDVEAYHQLMMDLVSQQTTATWLVIQSTDVTRLFVDGGFSKNEIYMHLLAEAFPHLQVFAASMPQATALGAALTIHHSWNGAAVPKDLVELKHYTATPQVHK